MSDDTTLDEFAVDSEESNESDMVAESKQTTDDLQTLETSPIENWELLRLGKVLSFEYGDNLPADTRQDGDIPVYGSNGQIDTHTEANVDRAGIIIGRKGSIGEGEFSNEPFWAIDTTYYISSEETDENLRFIHYLLQDMELERLNAASAIPGLNRNDAYNLNTLVPPLSEQRKIATVLHTVDQAIEKLGEVIEQASYLKKGVMQDLFTKGYYQHNNQKAGSIRWKNIPKSWSLPQLSEVVSINPNYNEVNKLVDYIEMDAVDTDLPEPSYIGHRNPQENSGRLFKQGDTLFARITPCTENGKICFVRGIDSEIGIGSTEYAVLSPESKLLPKYLYHYARTHQVRDYAISRMRGSTGRQRVPFDVFRKELHIPLPTKEEQQEIIDCLDSIDSIIRVNNRKREQLHRLKSGLMQDLLSGKVRTSNDNVDVPEKVAKYG